MTFEYMKLNEKNLSQNRKPLNHQQTLLVVSFAVGRVNEGRGLNCFCLETYFIALFIVGCSVKLNFLRQEEDSALHFCRITLIAASVSECDKMMEATIVGK